MGIRHLFPYEGNPAAAASTPVFGVTGYPTVSVQITGTFSSGTYTPQVSNDGGKTWASIPTLNGSNNIASTMGAVGVFRCDVNGFAAFRLSPSTPAGAHQIFLFASEEPLQIGVVAP